MKMKVIRHKNEKNSHQRHEKGTELWKPRALQGVAEHACRVIAVDGSLETLNTALSTPVNT